MIERIESLRRQRMPGKEIATALLTWCASGSRKAKSGRSPLSPKDGATFEQARQFARVAQLVRPIRVFREWHERRLAIDRAKAAE